jgi:hypothetical protein
LVDAACRCAVTCCWKPTIGLAGGVAGVRLGIIATSTVTIVTLRNIVADGSDGGAADTFTVGVAATTTSPLR